MSAIFIIKNMNENKNLPSSNLRKETTSFKDLKGKPLPSLKGEQSNLGGQLKNKNSIPAPKELAQKRELQKNSRGLKGDLCELKVTALGPNGVGIDEFSCGFSILIPNAKLGETVKVQIKRNFNYQKAKYAVAQILSTPEYNMIKTAQILKSSLSKKGEKEGISKSFKSGRPLASGSSLAASLGEKQTSLNQNLINNQEGRTPDQLLVSRGQNEKKINWAVGDILTVKLDHITVRDKFSIGQASFVNSKVDISSFSPNWKKTFIIPLDPQDIKGEAKVGKEIQVQLTKIKQKYTLAKIHSSKLSVNLKETSGTRLPSRKEARATTNNSIASSRSTFFFRNKQLIKGSKITLTLTKTTKKYANHIVILLKDQSSREAVHKVNPYVLFLKNSLGAKLGEKVRVKFIQIGSSFAVGKIIKIAPKSKSEKLARASLRLTEMLANEMHYGEKAIKCQAKMRGFIWNRRVRPLKKKVKSGSFPSLKGSNQRVTKPLPFINKITKLNKGVSVAALRPSSKNTNPLLIKKGRHLINLLKTRRCLNIGLNQLSKYAAKGRTFLFVGTKKPVASLIARAALFSKASFFVNTRWLGGMLTNWKTIVKSIRKIRPILKEKQKVISNILQKRAIIQTRLMKKILSVKKKSQVVINKGKLLINKLDPTCFASLRGQEITDARSGSLSNTDSKFILEKKLDELTEKDQKNRLFLKRVKLLERGQSLLKKRKSLLSVLLKFKTAQLKMKENGFSLANDYKGLLKKLSFMNKNLTKFVNESSFLSSRKIKKLVNSMLRFMLGVNKKMTELKTILKDLKIKFLHLVFITEKIQAELKIIKRKYISERQIIRVLRRKLKRFEAEKKLIQFSLTFRFLPTPKKQIAFAVQILMKRFVDPKLRSPIDVIYDEKLKKKSKKVAAARKKKWQRLESYFGGIANMTKLKKTQICNNVAIIVGQQKEMNAVLECKKLGIKMFHIVDTNCNPGLADHFIPSNDDSRNSIKYILKQVVTRIRLAQKIQTRFKVSPSFHSNARAKR